MLATRQILEVAVKPDDCSVCTPAIGMMAMIAVVAVSWLLQGETKPHYVTQEADAICLSHALLATSERASAVVTLVLLPCSASANAI